MIISPYTPDIVRPQYEAFKYDTDLIGKVLLYKQAAYDDAYRNIQNLRQKALNIQFLNEKEQRKIDHFNNQVNDFFSKNEELGDLSNSAIANKYTNIFNIIGKDPELIKRYKKDAKYQKMLLDVENKKNSKDPIKAGFHPVNYSNFLSRVQEYSETDLDTEDFEVRPYNNYIDYHAEIARLVKDVPIKKYTEERPTGDGRIVSITRVGRDPNEVRRVVSNFMQSKGAVQLREEAEYDFRSNQDIPGQAELYNNYTGYINQQKEILAKQLDSVIAQRKTATGEQATQLAEQQTLIETKLSDLDLSQYSPSQFYDRDQDEIIGDLTNVHLFNTTDNLTQAYGGFAESKVYKPDSALLQLMKLEQNSAVQQAKLRMAELKAQGKLASEGGPLEIDTPSVSQPVSVDFGSTLESIESSLTKLSASETNIFETGLQSEGQVIRTADQVANDLLRNPNALRDNAVYADSPWVKAFKLARLDALRKYEKVDDSTIPLMLEEIKPRIIQIINNPQTKQEVEINKEFQDIKANKQSVENFLEEANKSGDPLKYIEARPNIYTFGSGLKILDATGLTGDRAKMVDEAALTMYGVVQNHIGNVMPIKGEKGEQILSIERDWMKHAQIFDDGTVRLWMDPQLFKEGDPDESTTALRPGVLNNDYFMIDGKEQKPTVEKPYIQFKDPGFMKVNWSKHLGLRLTEAPQKRYGWSKDKKTVPFEIRMVDDQIQYAVNGGEFYDTGTSNPELVLPKIYDIISASNSTDFNKGQ